MRGSLIAFAGIAFFCLSAPDIHAQAASFYSIDTSRSYSPGCDTLPAYAYFQVKGKYPQSSQMLAKRADSALHGHKIYRDVQGYIIFRILIDCAGELAAVKLLQTNERYEPSSFPKEVVQDLYAFLRSLKSWKKASASGRPVNYFSYLSFKLEEGHVVQVSP